MEFDEFDEFEESGPSREAHEGDFDLSFACPPGERPGTIPEKARIEVEPEPRAPEARTFRHAPNALEELAEPAKIWIAAQTRPSMEAMLRHVMCATADMLVPGAGAAVSIGFRVERLWGVARSFLDAAVAIDPAELDDDGGYPISPPSARVLARWTSRSVAGCRAAPSQDQRFVHVSAVETGRRQHPCGPMWTNPRSWKRATRRPPRPARQTLAYRAASVLRSPTP